MNTKISCRTYMAWDYDKEEEHLDEMSEKGWQLKKGGCFFSVYTRQPGVVYRNRIDYNPDAVNSPEEKRRYLELFEEQGWEYVGNTYNGWIYFKKKYVPGTPEEEYERYTDAESLQSLLDRWKRLGILLSVLLLVLTAIYTVMVFGGRYYNIIFVAFYVVLLVWIQWGMRRMRKKVTGSRA